MARNRRESSGIVGNRRKKWGKVNAKIYVVHTKGIRMRLIICLYYVLICSSFALRNLFTFVMCLFIYLKELNSLCFMPSTHSPNFLVIHNSLFSSPTLQMVLQHYEHEFMELAIQCPSVVVCRCTPTQKADIVKLLKVHTGKRTCSIGDGGNDVSMIQMADAGIGIVGKVHYWFAVFYISVDCIFYFENFKFPQNIIF